MCVIDFNNDGWLDLFIVGGSGHVRYFGKPAWWHKQSGNKLLKNHSGKYFEDITQKANLTNSHWGMGCSVEDFDNDGLADLFITGLNDNSLYQNME